MSVAGKMFRIVFTILYAFCANGYLLAVKDVRWLFLFISCMLAVNLLSGFCDPKVKKEKLKFLNHGTDCLIEFAWSLVYSVIFHIFVIIIAPTEYRAYLFSMLFCYVSHFVLFWNGIITVYVTSLQLGVKQRVIGAICGPIPIANLFALNKIIRVTSKEVRFEAEKELLNRKREKEKICRTKYPLLLVHGVFFRDSEKLNYWGRIPAELERNGAVLYYGDHQSALSVEKSALEIAERVRVIVEKTGCGKLNVIAHSKGGLDTRYAISKLGIAPYVASLTTINTPHRGCNFADHLLSKIAPSVQSTAAAAYNSAAKVLGDTEPDFMSAVKDLTASACADFDRELTVPDSIFCRSIGSVLKKRTGGKFPLNISYPMVKKHDGQNDGLVSVDSFAFGSSCRILVNEGDRGISHADMIDLNRENIDGFDVREFYVKLVADLKNRGF